MAQKRNEIPAYYGFRIYLTATILYFFLVFPIVGILFLKYGSEWLQNTNNNLGISKLLPVADTTRLSIGDIEKQSIALLQMTDTLSDKQLDSLIQTRDSLLKSQKALIEQRASETQTNITVPENRLLETITILFKLLLLIFILGFAFNFPFKIYFRKKRKKKPVPEKLYAYCKKFLLKTPLINCFIVLLAFGTSLGYMSYVLLFFKPFDEITQRFYTQFFFISLVATALTVLFVYIWQKHRTHIKYIEHIFSKEELRKRIFNVRIGKIKNRLLISNGMTTFLPLTIVLFYLFLSLTSIKELGLETLSDAQLKIFFGKYLTYFSNVTVEDYQSFYYINSFDTLLMLAGIITGISVSLIYLIVFTRWTTQDIVNPVKELLNNMQLTGQGELDQLSIVRTNDEIGELTEGFNDMSLKLKEYFHSISKINQANSRFVPRQFLDFLGKESIADINLGDQVQKEMTILFSDIRNFTNISETMTPKENFNFLNNYLGYMEPVIRTHKGFIDKFMGDSIMALFSEKPEDAIHAAIEMRKRLQEFNQVIGQFGKNPINCGVGLHTGNLMLGIVGGEGRMDGTVISDSVNLASRIEGLTKIYGSSILISEDTLIKLNDPGAFQYRFIDIVKVKGKKEAVYIFEILDGEPLPIKELKLKTSRQFSEALNLYKNKDFENALTAFKEIIEYNKFDKAAEVYKKRCKKLIKHGTPHDWDGIEVIGDV